MCLSGVCVYVNVFLRVCVFVYVRESSDQMTRGRKSNDLAMCVCEWICWWDLSATPMRPDNLIICHLPVYLPNTQSLENWPAQPPKGCSTEVA